MELNQLGQSYSVSRRGMHDEGFSPHWSGNPSEPEAEETHEAEGQEANGASEHRAVGTGATPSEFCTAIHSLVIALALLRQTDEFAIVEPHVQRSRYPQRMERRPGKKQ